MCAQQTVRFTMQKLNSTNNCLTCLLQLDSENGVIQSAHILDEDEELQRMLVQHLDWQLQELTMELLRMPLCSACYQQLNSFDQFQRQARGSREHLLAMLQEARQLDAELESKSNETAIFEVVYEEEPLEAQQLLEPDCVGSQNSEASLPDPFDELARVEEAQQEHSNPNHSPDTAAHRRIKGLKNSFKCNQCGHCFAHSLTLAAHVRKVHEGKKRPFQCDRCEKAYSFMGGLYTHIKEIHEPAVRSYPCNQPGCDRIYTSCIAMQKHKRVKHSSTQITRKYVCEQCGATFNQTANLKYHHRTKHPTAEDAAANTQDSERHFCNICQKHFHSRYTLRYHTMQQHENAAQQMQHECQVCGRRMAKRFMLVQHMLMHSTDKIPCEHCGRLFARKFELEAHIRAVHLKLKPFACKYCAESFASRKTLRHHEYIHTGEKPYVCVVCGQAFRQQTCLKNHGKVHEKPPAATADKCFA